MELVIPKQDFTAHYNNVLIKYQIPFEIKNDIIYCQKALRTYLKVHQMVIINFGQKLTTALSAVRKLLDDLEREIYEINAEQRFLIYRLRKSLEDFYKSLPVNNIIIDRDADNIFLRHTFSKYVDDPNYPCEAITVKTRKSFNQWKRKFSLDDPKRLLNIKNSASNNTTKSNIPPCNGNSNAIISNLQQKQRVSLLKPKCERDLNHLNDSNQSTDIKNEDDVIFPNENDKILPNNDITHNVVADSDEKLDSKIESKVEDQSSVALKPSPAMNIGRMKLLQALNKAKNQKETPTSQSPASTAKTVAPIKITQKSPEQQKNPKYTEILSSSDDSLDGINVLPPIEPEKEEITEINQEMFLRQFGLYTLQHSAYLKQRRSKRRRRNVQFNERKDFHYGTLNLAAIDAQTATYPKEKKKKIFLVSPTVSRRAKRRRSAKDEIVNNKSNNKSDRSSMSSPDEKLFCNVCFRNNELLVLNRCKKCKQNYHTSCHSKIYFNSTKKICPVCIRVKKTSRSASSEDINRGNNVIPSRSRENKVRRSSLIDRCNELKQKFATAQIRQNTLLKESEVYKTKMNELFNIVDTIKNKQTENETKAEAMVFSIEISDEEVNEAIDDVDSSEKGSLLSMNSQQNCRKEKLNQVISSQLSNKDDDISNDTNSNYERLCEQPVDSDEEILVIKEDANIIEIKDAPEEEIDNIKMA